MAQTRKQLDAQIGTAVKAARLEEGHAGLRKFCLEADMEPSNLSGIEHGDRPIGWATLLKLAKILNRRIVVTLEKIK